MNNTKKTVAPFNDYSKIFVVTVFVIVFLRIIETAFIGFRFMITVKILLYEVSGLFFDITIAGFFLYLSYFPFKYFYKRIGKRACYFMLFIISIFNIFHLIILKYFLYQLRPLDIFLYEHSLRESLFSYKTSNTSYTDVIFTAIFITTIIILFYRFIRKIIFPLKLLKALRLLLFICLVLFPVFEIFGVFNFNNFSNNKSYYFYKRSIGYLFKKEKQKFITFDIDILEKYQQIFKGKHYLSLEYPLEHKFENKDVLTDFFQIDTTVSPNLVFIIFEGMSDEFIHNYKGLKLMPFVDSLSKNSLYWKNFFSLGERSFAVVPSITGGLPYGERGFTLLNRMPYHFSLINILKKNGYYSIYFDSQDAWFHDKDKYFKFNNIDRIFDKEDFSSKYHQVYIGDNKTFWGFDDKDFFNQALEVMDTLPVHKRLEIYFTGTMHSPFYVENKEKYNKLLDKKLEKITNQDTAKFLKTYRKQLLSIMFTNDAISEFIHKYKKRPEYKNTIFIITGDHPMTEIPPEDQVKKYHVPLIIYSSRLKKPVTFSGISSHLDVYESILAFLHNNYEVDIPKVSSSIGYKLDTGSVKNEKIFAFMNDNREIVDLYDDKYFLSNNSFLYEVKDRFKIKKISNRPKLKQMESVLKTFNTVNEYINVKRKLIRDTDYFGFFNYKVLYNFTKSGCKSFNGEYHSIKKNIPIKNMDIYTDISVDYKPDINEKTRIYYTLSDNSGKKLYSNYFELNYKMQEHQFIKKQDIQDSILYLSVYIDNRAFKHIEYCNPEIKVYATKAD